LEIKRDNNHFDLLYQNFYSKPRNISNFTGKFSVNFWKTAKNPPVKDRGIKSAVKL